MSDTRVELVTRQAARRWRRLSAEKVLEDMPRVTHDLGSVALTAWLVGHPAVRALEDDPVVETPGGITAGDDDEIFIEDGALRLWRGQGAGISADLDGVRAAPEEFLADLWLELQSYLAGLPAGALRVGVPHVWLERQGPRLAVYSLWGYAAFAV